MGFVTASLKWTERRQGWSDCNADVTRITAPVAMETGNDSMTFDKDDENRSTDSDATLTPNSPFRRITASGDSGWQRPPQLKPVNTYAPTSATVTVPQAYPMDSVDAATRASGSRFRFVTVLGLVGGIFLLTAVAGGAYLAYQALLGHENRVTAEYAPADSWAYVAVNVDPTSHAWLDAWGLAKSAGIDDELARLPEDGLAESGADPALWETLVKPAIGRELGFAVWPNADSTDAEPNLAAIVMIADEVKAREAIDELMAGEPTTETTYRDISYLINDDDNAAGIVDEALILAATSEAFEDIVDARRDGALDEVAAFTAAGDRAADDPLVFVYIDSAAIAEAAATLQNDVVDAAGGVPFGVPDLGSTLDMYASLGRITTTIKAEGNALQTEVLTDGRPENFPMTPAGNGFADQMPASTLFYLASADFYGTIWQPTMEQIESMFGEMGSGDMGGMPTLDDVEMMLGFDVDGDLMAHFTGAYATSLNVEETAGGYGAQFHMFSELSDALTVEETIDDLVMTLGGGLPAPIDGGYRLDIPEEDVSLELTVVDDVLHLTGSYRASAAGGTLANEPSFKTAMAKMPEDPTLVGYLAVDRLMDMMPPDEWEDADADMRAAFEAFGPLAFATAPDGDGTRTVVVITMGR